jgi:hypothetical protein
MLVELREFERKIEGGGLFFNSTAGVMGGLVWASIFISPMHQRSPFAQGGLPTSKLAV